MSDLEFDSRRRQFRLLCQSTRQRLAAIYRQAAPDAQALAVLKNQAMQDFRADYAALKSSWGGYAAYDAWVAAANNAAFGAQAAYDELVPAFEALFEREGQDWQCFYAALMRLAKLPQDERLKTLAAR